MVVFGVDVVVLVDVLAQLGLESANGVLKLDDIIPTDLLPFRGIEILAYRTGSFAREASWECGIASGFSLTRLSQSLTGV